MSFEYLKRDSSMSTILNPSSTPSCIAQLPTCADNSFNTSSSGICCSAMLSIPIKADLFHQIFKYIVVTRLTRRVSLTSVAGTAYLSGAPEFTPGFQWGSCYSIFCFCVCFVDRCLYFFFWPLSCLFFFDIRIPIVSSNSSQLVFKVHVKCAILSAVSWRKEVASE